MDADLARRPVAVFGYADIGNPFRIFFIGMVYFPFLSGGIVVILTVDEDDDISVLLDRTAVSLIGKLRLTVLPDFCGAAQLGNRNYRHL